MEIQIPTWETITVKQFQDFYRISNSEIPEEEKIVGIISALTVMDQETVEMLSIDDAIKICKAITSNLSEPLKCSHSKKIFIGGQVFRPIYKPMRLTVGAIRQVLIVSKHDEKYFISFMHTAIAPLIEGRQGVATPSDVLLNARFVDIYSLFIYYLRLYRACFKLNKTYYKSKLISTDHLTPNQADEIVESMIAVNNDLEVKFIPSLKISA